MRPRFAEPVRSLAGLRCGLMLLAPGQLARTAQAADVPYGDLSLAARSGAQLGASESIA